MYCVDPFSDPMDKTRDPVHIIVPSVVVPVAIIAALMIGLVVLIIKFDIVKKLRKPEHPPPADDVDMGAEVII